MPAWCARAGASAWQTGRPTASSGQLFKTIGKYLPPAAGLKSPALWGSEAHLKELLPGCNVQARTQIYTFHYQTPAHWLEVFRTYYGPTNRAFAALDAKTQDALANDILTLIDRSRNGKVASLVVPSDYL